MPLPSTFAIDGKTYILARPMSVPDQMHVARKLGPFLPRIPRVLRALQALGEDEVAGGAEQATLDAAPPDQPAPGSEADAGDTEMDVGSGDKFVDDVLSSVEPMLALFAEMRDEDVNAIMSKCFRCVDKVGLGGTQPIWNSRSNSFQFENDIDLGVAAMICWEVVKASIGPFLRAKLSSFLAQQPRQAILR